MQRPPPIIVAPAGMNRDLITGFALALVLHLGVGWWGAGLELHHAPPPLPKRNVAKAVYRDVELPPPPKPKPPKPPEPKPEPVVEKEAVKAKPKKPKGQPKRKKKRKRKRKKPDNTPKPLANEPAPLVLSKTYGATADGGVVVQSGDDDMFGDPAVAATERNTRPRGDDGANDATPGPTSEGGTAKERRVVIVHAKPKHRCKVAWPAGAPVSRRVIEVTLLLSVSTTGKVSTKRILKSAGEPFDSAAKSALRQCRFTAGRRDGKAFTDRVPFVVAFRPGDGA